MSYFKEYIEEYHGKFLLEDEDGFVTYLFESDYVYIDDVYVVKDKRKNGIARKYMNKVVDIAKEKGYTKMLGSIDMNGTTPNSSMKFLLSLKFKIIKSTEDMIYLMKEI